MPSRSIQPNEAREEDPANVSLLFWARVVVIGVAAGVGGAALLWILRLVQHAAWGYEVGSFYDGVAAAPAWRRVLVLAGAGVVAAVAGRLLRIADPGHGGGLEESIWFRDGRMPFLRTLGRALESIVVVAMGVSLGREGALKQVGAAAASLLTRRRSSGPERRLLAACGAAAGMAAAYSVPLGGALFGMEVLLGSISVELAMPMLLATLIADAVTKRILHTGVTYVVPPFVATPKHFLWAVLVGPLFGVVAAVYVRFIAFVDGRKPTGELERFVAPILACVVVGVAGIAWPELLGNGRNLVQAALKSELPLVLLLVLALGKPLATGLGLGAGIPGGLFTPTCCLGALLGGALGHLFSAVVPGAPDGSYALLGMAAVLAASTHGPISSLVMAAELTASAELVLPGLVACALAVLVARAIESRSIYTARLHRRMRETTAKPPPGREVVSSAARFSAVATSLLALERDQQLWVVGPEGDVIGRVARERVTELRRELKPSSMVIAADLVEPAPS